MDKVVVETDVPLLDEVEIVAVDEQGLVPPSFWARIPTESLLVASVMNLEDGVRRIAGGDALWERWKAYEFGHAGEENELEPSVDGLEDEFGWQVEPSSLVPMIEAVVEASGIMLPRDDAAATLWVAPGSESFLRLVEELSQFQYWVIGRYLGKMFAVLPVSGSPALWGEEDKTYDAFINDVISKSDASDIAYGLGFAVPLETDQEWVGRGQQIAGDLRQYFGEFPEFEDYEFEKYGVRWQGVKMRAGYMPAEAKEEGMHTALQMMKNIYPFVDKRFQRWLADSGLMVVVGEQDGHQVLFVGNEKGLLFSNEEKMPSEVRVARGKAGGLNAEQIFALAKSSRQFSSLGFDFLSSNYRKLVDGYFQELLVSEGPFDLRGLRALVDAFEANSAKQKTAADCQAVTVVSYLEKGSGDLVYRQVGGMKFSGVDYMSGRAKFDLAKIEGLGGEPLVFVGQCSVANGWNDLSQEMLAILASMLDLGISEVARMELNPEVAEEYSPVLRIYQRVGRQAAIDFFDAYWQAAGHALSGDTLLLVDGGGAMPAIPLMGPELGVDGAKFPRISLVTDINERKTMGESWQKMESVLAGVVAEMGREFDFDWTLPKVMSEENSGVRHHYYLFPGMADEFFPCVSVNDASWGFGTSRKLNERGFALLSEDQSSSASSEQRGGIQFELRLGPLLELVETWVGEDQLNRVLLDGEGNEIEVEFEGEQSVALDFSAIRRSLERFEKLSCHHFEGDAGVVTEVRLHRKTQ